MQTSGLRRMSLEQSGKAPRGDDLKSGELLVIDHGMILTVDEKSYAFKMRYSME